MPATVPDDPFALVPRYEFAPAARRELTVFGAPAELVWLPHRKARPGVPTGARPPFRTSHIARILAEETVWRGRGAALTGNRYPFATAQCVLWSEEPLREPSLAMLELMLAWEVKTNGTVLVNSVGAAASIARAHVHLVAERLPFFAAVPKEPCSADWLEGADALRLARPFPCVAVGVRGDAATRARAALRLMQIRTTAAVNLVSLDGVTWVLPHGEIEIPAPHFPHALGAAELWGRWCYADEEPFSRATARDLERAIATSGLATDPAR